MVTSLEVCTKAGGVGLATDCGAAACAAPASIRDPMVATAMAILDMALSFSSVVDVGKHAASNRDSHRVSDLPATFPRSNFAARKKL
jgi:hypothetical protein